MRRARVHQRGRAQQQVLRQALAEQQREVQVAQAKVATLEAQYHAGKLWLAFVERLRDHPDMRQTVFGNPEQPQQEVAQ